MRHLSGISITKLKDNFNPRTHIECDEVKDVFATREEAEAWISENRAGNEDICRIERWSVDFTKKKMEDR